MNTIVVKQTVTRNMFGQQVADGWTPLLAAVEDGERRVFQITDWIGGTGDKPPVGLYLGEHGLVLTPAEATDIGVPTDYSSRDALAGAQVPAPVQYVRTAGYAEAGDGGGALYRRVAFEPGHGGKVQSADGAWWELVETEPSILMFGGVGDGDTNNDTAFAAAEAYGRPCYIPEGTFATNLTLDGLYYGPGYVGPKASPRKAFWLGQKIATGSSTVLGAGAGALLDAGEAQNTLVGFAAGRNITTGTKNVFLGVNGGSGNAAKPPVVPMTGSDNIGIGFHAVKKCETGSMNIGIGTDAGNEITTGNDNTCVGGSAGQQITTGSGNVAIGRAAALRLGTDATGGGPENWVPVGGDRNVAIGRNALRGGYDCSNNVAIGAEALCGPISADLTGTITGGGNVVIGDKAAKTGPTTLANNVIVGAEAGEEITTGSRNVIIGRRAARTITSGSGNVILGDSTSLSSDTSNRFHVSNQTGLPFLQGFMEGPGHADNNLRVDGVLRPASDATRVLGTSIARWDVVYSATGTINTSDEREKTDIGDIPDEWLDAWGDVEWSRYKWQSAIARKGDGARWHLGLVAQRVRDAFTARGLDPFAIGLLCYDEWEESEDTPAGNRFGLRYEEAFALEAAWQRRRADWIEARLDALEAAHGKETEE